MLIQIEVSNWSDYNPRSDRANYTWFRFQNNFFQDQRIFALTDAQKCLYMFILCSASQTNSGKFELCTEFASTFLKHKESDIQKNLIILEERGVMTARCRRDDGAMPSLRPATYVRTNVTNVTNETKDVTSELRNQLLGGIDSLKNISPKADERLKQVKQSIQELWVSTYSDVGWIRGELLQAVIWIETNPQKAPKKFDRFMSAWLARSWERFRKTLPSNAPRAPAPIPPKPSVHDPAWDELKKVRKELGLDP